MMVQEHVHHPVNREIAIKFDAVSFAYGDTTILEDISFHIHRGEFVALVGPNGSGKTTIIKLLLGLEQPAKGRIELSGCSSAEKAKQAAAWRNRLGYVPQQPLVDHQFPILVQDVVRMGLLRPSAPYAAPRDRVRDGVKEALEQTGVADLALQAYSALSGGQRRRVLVARALASRPEILVLDEPTANMDSESEARLFEALGALKGKTTILIVTHDTDFVSVLTDRVLCLDYDESKGAGKRRRIVQHPTATAATDTTCRHNESAAQGVRAPRVALVLHGENIPADDCHE